MCDDGDIKISLRSRFSEGAELVQVAQRSWSEVSSERVVSQPWVRPAGWLCGG